MRQQRWFELLADYNLDFTNHKGKANLVVDALSRNSTHPVSALTGSDELIRDFAKLNSEIVREGELSVRLNALSIQPLFFAEVMSAQDQDPKLVKLKAQERERQAEGFSIHEDRILRFKGTWCLPSGELSLKDEFWRRRLTNRSF